MIFILFLIIIVYLIGWIVLTLQSPTVHLSKMYKPSNKLSQPIIKKKSKKVHWKEPLTSQVIIPNRYETSHVSINF